MSVKINFGVTMGLFLFALVSVGQSNDGCKETEMLIDKFVSSTIGSCDNLSRYDFLRIMLANLNDLHNDSSLLCHPELLK